MLAGCGARTVIEHQTINYVFEPEVYQHCEDEPAPPRDGASNGEWIENHEAVRSAGQDCRNKVNGGRDWQLEQRRKVQGPSQPVPPLPSWWDKFYGGYEPKKNPS